MSEDFFNSQYANLNKPQREAVDTIDGPVMVIAGPGTGKTTILTLRIANILKQTDTPAHGILAITYTEAGVRAMRTKLEKVIGKRAYDVHIHTFHGFAASIIAEYPSHFIHLDGLEQITDIEQETLIKSIISEAQFADLRPLGKPDAYVSGILRSIDDAKREALTPKLVKKHAQEEIERIKNDEASISTRGATKGQLKAEAKEQIEKCERTILFADVYEAYEDRKREAKKMDFSDLIIELLAALRNDELLLRLVQERFLYILVDEHQDTNDAQNFIVALIAEFFETPNIFIVGDDKQAIYRFQGASVENFLLLKKRYPAMKTISLDTNYRSHSSILDASFAMIENNYEGDESKELRIRLKGGKKGINEIKKSAKGKDENETRAVKVITGENVGATEQRFVADIERISKEKPEATIAIIVRRNRDLDRVIRLLEAHHVPVASERSVDIFNHPVGALFFELITYISDPSRVDALAKTITAGMWNMSFEKGGELIKALRSGTASDIDTKLPGLKKIVELMLVDAPVGFIIHAADVSGFATLVARDPSYIHVWRGIVALAESLTRDSKIKDPAKLMIDMLAYKVSAESRTVKVAVGAPDAPIHAMTAHGSKGLEFDFVFIPYACEETWVGKPRGSSFVLPRKRATDNDIRDVRRLFYVALTRAREEVTILSGLEESDGKTLSPLRFIGELDQGHVEVITLPRTDTATTMPVATDMAVDTVGTKLVDRAKHELLERGLSVTALNHFLECPNKFLYQSILRLPQAPSVPAEKGNAMHSAISRVWKSTDKSVSGIETTLVQGITDFMADSFLPLTEKQAVQKELLESALEVARALEVHFMMKGEVFTETWVKTVFKGVHGQAKIEIPLHGKLDAILDTPSIVSVFDYKTRQAMSVNAIKGETKSSNGDYFRQLVFYKILLSDDVRWRTKKISPALVFVSPDDKGRCSIVELPIVETDIETVKSAIQSLIDSVWSGVIARATCGDIHCEWCGLRSVYRR